ncbi:MAG: hypothetical protein ABIQ75_02425 [Flavobacteriales bacterium]
MARELPKRHTIRMRGYDYAQQGAYYLTICTEDRLHRFGSIVDGVMHLSPVGELAQRCWDAIPEHMAHVDIDELVVMPNHIHGIVIIRERLVATGSAGADHGRPGTLKTDTTNPPDTTTSAGPLDNDERPIGMDHDLDNTDVINPPGAQRRADHDRPLRPSTDPSAPRAMPVVPHGSLGRIVRAYKSAVTRIAYRDSLLPRGTPFWQRNYWDDIIRDRAEWMRIAKYIRDNPENWKGDRFGRSS